MENIAFLKRQIQRNTKRFYTMVDGALLQKTEEKRLEKAVAAAHFAWTHALSVYSSSALEQIFLDIASRLHTDTAGDFQKGTVLHVMSEAYTSGGHTRCVERWMETAGTGVRHSCVLLRQKAPWPEQLKVIAEGSGGSFTVLDPAMPLADKALALRRLASAFEYVVLHIHPDDATALIAFGTEEFSRPVIFFEHASQAFWLGVSIADCVAALSSPRVKLSLERRKAACARFLGIPQETQHAVVPDKKAARERFGIPPEAKVVFSSGNPAKYLCCGKSLLFGTLNFLLQSDDRVLAVLIGPSTRKDKELAALQKQFPERVLVQKIMEYHKGYLSWLACADLVLDSWPVGGGTAVLDAIHAGKPVLPLTWHEYLLQTQAFCNTAEEFREKSLYVLQSPDFALNLAREQRAALDRMDSAQAWLSRLHEILAVLPARHHVHSFQSPSEVPAPDANQLNVCLWVQPELARSRLSRFLKFLCSLSWSRRRKAISLCGIKLLDIKAER